MESTSIRWRRWFQYLQERSYEKIIHEFEEFIKEENPKPYDIDCYKEALSALGVAFLRA